MKQSREPLSQCTAERRKVNKNHDSIQTIRRQQMQGPIAQVNENEWFWAVFTLTLSLC
jgi:hypothetical protein